MIIELIAIDIFVLCYSKYFLNDEIAGYDWLYGNLVCQQVVRHERSNQLTVWILE